MTKINEMVFVSRINGAQDFVAWNDEKSIAIFGNMQASKWNPKSAVQVNKKDVIRKIIELKNRGYKVIDAYRDDYEDVLKASKLVENN